MIAYVYKLYSHLRCLFITSHVKFAAMVEQSFNLIQSASKFTYLHRAMCGGFEEDVC